MNHLIAKVMIGTLTVGALGAGGYLTYNFFSIKTIGDELLAENSGNRLLKEGDSKWEERAKKYKSGNNIKAIVDLDLSQQSEETLGQKLRQKCQELWNISKTNSEKEKRREELSNWCLENSNVDI